MVVTLLLMMTTTTMAAAAAAAAAVRVRICASVRSCVCGYNTDLVNVFVEPLLVFRITPYLEIIDTYVRAHVNHTQMHVSACVSACVSASVNGCAHVNAHMQVQDGVCVCIVMHTYTYTNTRARRVYTIQSQCLTKPNKSATEKVHFDCEIKTATHARTHARAHILEARLIILEARECDVGLRDHNHIDDGVHLARHRHRPIGCADARRMD